ncbi:MAG: hydantoinase B/oxoprolinase family protein [Myxococcales bacterium]|nr:hydantoinase B/oxoprolinase family protein [Myxococcales bacterium]
MAPTLGDAVEIEVWNHLFAQVAEEMGATLRLAALSPNIKERRDYSCAIFDGEGRMIAQAAHIPVHLGSTPLSVRAAIAAVAMSPGDVVILNDPFAGGTHLPDVTLVAPVDVGEGQGEAQTRFYVANRAHHADVGGTAPGSMPAGVRGLPGELPEAPPDTISVGARRAGPGWEGALSIDEEGIRLPPMLLTAEVADRFAAASRTPDERQGDLAAQRAALAQGGLRLAELAARHGARTLELRGAALRAYAARLMRAAIEAIPDGIYAFADTLDEGEAIRVCLTIAGARAIVDFSDSDPESPGSLNAVYAVTVSSVLYAFRLLCPDDTPTNEGILDPIEVIAPEGTIVAARPPRAVAAGNVETSQRIVDVVLGALAQALPGRIPAASGGTMSNLMFGGALPPPGSRSSECSGGALPPPGSRSSEPHRPAAGGSPASPGSSGTESSAAGSNGFAYYETIACGAGGGPTRAGASAIQTHMTNTWNTPVEALEHALPVRVIRYAIRRGSGGGGAHPGGDGVVRTLEFLAAATVTLIGDRRRRPPYGLAGGGPGDPGIDTIERAGRTVRLPSKVTFEAQPGDRLTIATPGGGGHGRTRPLP